MHRGEHRVAYTARAVRGRERDDEGLQAQRGRVHDNRGGEEDPRELAGALRRWE